MYAFSPSTGRQRQAELSEFKAILVYRGSSRIAGATQRNPFSGGKRFVMKGFLFTAWKVEGDRMCIGNEVRKILS